MKTMLRSGTCQRRRMLAAVLASLVLLGSTVLSCPLLAAEPPSPQKLFSDGVELLFAGKPQDSAAAFEVLATRRPELEPELWQRGLTLYYAGRYADGVAQFERHREVNPADVENATWHFACLAKAKNVETARQQLLPVGSDGRIPMKEVLDLYHGQGSSEKVLAAADAGPESKRRNQRCYAHLYLGLLAEAEGNAAEAERQMTLAAGTYRMDHFMGKIAQLHCQLRGWKVP